MSLAFESLAIPDVKLLVSSRIEDSRGFFSEIHRRDVFEAAGMFLEFVQDNLSMSIEAGTIRGLHFQTQPFAQAKLIRVIRGRVFDVAVDLRASSPTYGTHVSVELSAAGCRQLLVPVGFAHGFCTLEPNTELEYKVTNYYAPEHDRGLLWNDPDLKIDWPLHGLSPHLSDRDRQHPRLKDLVGSFA